MHHVYEQITGCLNKLAEKSKKNIAIMAFHQFIGDTTNLPIIGSH